MIKSHHVNNLLTSATALFEDAYAQASLNELDNLLSTLHHPNAFKKYWQQDYSDKIENNIKKFLTDPTIIPSCNTQDNRDKPVLIILLKIKLVQLLCEAYLERGTATEPRVKKIREVFASLVLMFKKQAQQSIPPSVQFTDWINSNEDNLTLVLFTIIFGFVSGIPAWIAHTHWNGAKALRTLLQPGYGNHVELAPHDIVNLHHKNQVSFMILACIAVVMFLLCFTSSICCVMRFLKWIKLHGQTVNPFLLTNDLKRMLLPREKVENFSRQANVLFTLD